MQEKLYFKPADYGKGAKNKKTNSENHKNEDNKKNHKFIKLGLILLVIAIVILAIIYFLRGKTANTNEKIPNIKSTALTCSSNSLAYPLFRYDNSNSRNLEIKMIFSEEKLKSIALEYSLFYDSAESIKASEAHNHAEMNISFAQAGLNPDNYDAKYSILSDQMRMNLYSVSSRLNDAAKPYFLIQLDGEFPTDKPALRQNYESQGFTCEASE